jgi:hypothetical protein
MSFGASHQILHLSTIDAISFDEIFVFKPGFYEAKLGQCKAIGYSAGLYQHR